MNLPSEGNRTYKLLRVPVFVLLVCFFSFVARHRLIDGDEGFYLMTSRLVLEHKLPYLDFFYTQTPLLPYAYGLWMKLFGISWFAARSLSAALTIFIGMLIYEYVCRETQKWIAGLIAVILFGSSTYIFAWFPIVKTYSLTALFLFSAYTIVTRLSPSSSPWLVAAGGLLFGLSVDTRSYVVGLAPLFLWWISRQPETRHAYSRILWFLGGFTIAILPCLYLFVVSPDLFLFDNFGYHAIRSNSGLIGDWKQKMIVAAQIVLLRISDGDNTGQFRILSAVSLAAILALRMRRSAALLAFLIAFVLGLISILPTPSFVQYFCLCVPFLVVAAACATNEYIASLQAGAPKRTLTLIGLAVLLAAFVASSAPSLRRYLVTGDSIIGVRDTYDAPNWTLGKVSAVSRAIDQLAAPNEEIASFWPGYIFASKTGPYPGFENDFGWLITDRLTADQRAKYHIIGTTEVEADFAAHNPRIVVLGNQGNNGSSRPSEYAKILRANDYTAVLNIGDTSIFVCCSTRH